MSRAARLPIGTVIKAQLPAQGGAEQEGNRPAVVVGAPWPSRFPLVVVVPFTSDKGQPWPLVDPALYPYYAAGPSGLTRRSIALVDQVRALDPAGVTAIIGAVTPADLRPIQDGLRRLLGL